MACMFFFSSIAFMQRKLSCMFPSFQVKWQKKTRQFVMQTKLRSKDKEGTIWPTNLLHQWGDTRFNQKTLTTGKSHIAVYLV